MKITAKLYSEISNLSEPLLNFMHDNCLSNLTIAIGRGKILLQNELSITLPREYQIAHCNPWSYPNGLAGGMRGIEGVPGDTFCYDMDICPTSEPDDQSTQEY